MQTLCAWMAARCAQSPQRCTQLHTRICINATIRGDLVTHNGICMDNIAYIHHVLCLFQWFLSRVAHAMCPKQQQPNIMNNNMIIIIIIIAIRYFPTHCMRLVYQIDMFPHTTWGLCAFYAPVYRLYPRIYRNAHAGIKKKPPKQKCRDNHEPAAFTIILITLIIKITV